MRFNIEPRDVPSESAARRIGLSLARFNEVLADLTDRGFPRADPTTGNYDLDAIDEWRKRRFPDLFNQGLANTSATTHGGAVVRDRLRSAPWAGSK
jgi:hypothetical protein